MNDVYKKLNFFILLPAFDITFYLFSYIQTFMLDIIDERPPKLLEISFISFPIFKIACVAHAD